MAPQDSARTAYGMWVILAGLAAMTAVTVVALLRYSEPTAIVTALGPVTGVIGTLVGAYFGLRGSSLAQQHAIAGEAAREKAAAAKLSTTNGHGDASAVGPPAQTTSSASVDATAADSKGALDPR